MPTTTTTTTSGRGNVKELLGTLFIAIVAIGVVYFRQTDGKNAAKAPWGDIPEGAPGDDFFGFWQGYLNQAAVGPLGDLWNFSLTKDVPGATVPTWYGENNYGGYLTRGGVQWYWVQFDQNMTDSNITYCGELRGFVDQLDPVRIRVAFPQLRRNATYIEWYLDHHFYNLTARLIWNLVDNGRKMRITFTMPADNVIHADLYMWRVPAIVPPAPTPEPCNMSFMDTKGDPAAPSYQDPVPIPHIDSVRNEKYTKRDKDGKIYKARLGQGCPLGFDKNKKEKIAKAKALAPRGSYMGYEHCYLINPTMNFTMRFNMSYKENLTHVLFSASVPAGKDINTHWLALGITPLWPLMKGMDVVMGYFGQRKQEACVRSMYAEMDVGAPIPNEVHHVVLNRKVWTESNTMYVSFSRPFKTGYNDIVNPPNLHILPSISFAMGPAPGDCLDAPEYHGTTRGTYGWNWTHIGETLPPHMMCQSA